VFRRFLLEIKSYGLLKLQNKFKKLHIALYKSLFNEENLLDIDFKIEVMDFLRV